MFRDCDLSVNVIDPTGHCIPPARSGHRCVADNANLYVFGGYNPDFEEAGGSENEDYPLFRELWRFHFATATWQQVRTEGYMPTELASMSGRSQQVLVCVCTQQKVVQELYGPLNIFRS